MRIKTTILFRVCLTAMLSFPLCASAGTTGNIQTCMGSDGNRRTPEAEQMLTVLKEVPERGALMFGHHDDPIYGIGWENEPGRSDVKSVCGDYPAIMSFDLGHIEHGDSVNLDKVAFDKIRQECIAQYERGGMVSFSWHVDNPLTGKDAWDVSDSNVVRSVLPGGKNHDKFTVWLDRAADFLNSIKTGDGVKVPILFRPWHEHTGSWFWWGQALCTDSEYVALWQMTYSRMREKDATQLLWAYSPGTEPKDSTEYLRRYPGDSIVDLIGTDTYQRENKAEYVESLNRLLDIMTRISKTHGKAMALTETGYESLPDAEWWTKTLMPIISKYPISYVLVWRNARENPKHFFAPYPGQASAADFVKFYQDRRTIFAGDIGALLR